MFSGAPPGRSEAFAALTFSYANHTLQNEPLTLNQPQEIVYDGNDNGTGFHAETRVSAYLSQSGLTSFDPIFGYGYTTTTLTIDASSYLSTAGATNGGSTRFQTFFWLYSDEPFNLSVEASTQGIGFPVGFAQVHYPVAPGGPTGSDPYDPTHTYADIIAPTGPLSFTESDVTYSPGTYYFRLQTRADGSATQTAGGFSSVSFSMTANVPEPSAVLLLLGGLGMVICSRRRMA